MSISIAAFAYVGVEIVAASALEAQWPGSNAESEAVDQRADTDLSKRSSEPPLIGKTVKFSSIYISVLATAVYVVGGVLAAFDMPREDCRLPRLSWIDYTYSNDGCSSSQSATTNNSTTSSAFVAIAQEATGLPKLPDAFNFFLVFTALTCADTNLYVASRSLFGLTSRLDDGGGQRGQRNPLRHVVMGALAWLGRTDSHGVPRRSVIVSALAFIWVPFLQLAPGGVNGDTTTPIGKVSLT
jgi:amino acid transporter